MTLLKTAKITVKRKPKRARYDKGAFISIVHQSHIGHMAFNDQNSIHTIPMICWCFNDDLYLHASPGGRIARLAKNHAPVSISFSILDGYVLAKSAMHHSLNYRSAVIYGNCQLVNDNSVKNNALKAMMNYIDEQRWNQVRPPNENELNAVAVIKLPINEAVIKQRSGPPEDKTSDLNHPVWTGVIPIYHHTGNPMADAYSNNELQSELI